MSMEEWKKYKLEDLLDIPIRNGLTKPKAIRGEGVKMIGMKEIFAYDIIRDCEMELVPVTDKELLSSSIMQDDLLFARQSLTLEGAGKCSIVSVVKEDTVFESHLIRLRINKNISNPYFIFYYFNSRFGKEQIKSLVQQVAAAGIRGKELIKLEIFCPSLPTQQKIANILSSLDDKIETNRRINEQLEELAQALFKSWFVDFEPFKDGKFVESELGMIPEGWKVGTLGEISVISSGKRPPLKQTEMTDNINIPLIGASSIMGYTNDILYDKAILIIGRVGTHGIVQRFYKPCWPSDNTLVIISENYEYVYQILKTIDYKSLNRGSTQPLITQTDIKNQLIILPNDDILEKYDESVSKLMKKYNSNLEEITHLTNLRDTLLPKLMSGEIDVSEVEI